MRETGKKQGKKNDIEIMDLNRDKGRRKKKTGSSAAKPAGRSAVGDAPKKAAAKKISNREFAVVTYFFLFLFIALTGYFIYFMVFRSEDFINSPYNARLDTFAETTVRGRILAQDQAVLAETVTGEDGSEVRSYPYGSVFSHVVGYATHGMAGVELDANFNLLRSNSFILQRLLREVRGEKKQGDDVVTSLNVDAQRAAYEGLGGYDGAVVAIEPSTGKIIAMVSKPDYDPNAIGSRWTEYTSEDSTSTALLNRATQGLYPPGSTFKIVTALEFLRQQGGDAGASQFHFDCNGTFEHAGFQIHCYHNTAHGSQDLTDAFANSCNGAFSTIGLSLDVGRWQETCASLLFNASMPVRISNTKSSQFVLDQTTADAAVMQTSIGQGDTLVTPIHMAMIAAAIANDGVLMEPYVIDYVQNDAGDVVKTYSSRTVGNLLTSSEASSMERLMEQAAQRGTGGRFSDASYQVFGKTGTAEYNSNKDDNHSWFVGYARDVDGRKLAIAVIMEGAGSGSAHAAPLARQVFDAYYH